MSFIGTRMKPSTSGPKPAWILGLPVADSVAMERPWKAFSYTTISGGDALVVAELACNLQRGLVGLQPELQKNTLLMPERSTSLAAAAPAGHVVVVGGVDELRELVLQRGHQLGVVVAQGVDGNAAQRVEVLLAVDVPDAAALAVDSAIGTRP
jgi:hypothetical protein